MKHDDLADNFADNFADNLAGSLVSLQTRHQESLKRFLAEFESNPEELHGYFCPRDASITEAVHSLDAWSRGDDLPNGWVPCSTWFWEAGGELRGVINVRHTLTPALEEVGGHIGYSVAPSARRCGVASAMLATVLPHCHALQIQRALLTCNATNIGSRLTIERQGGQLEREAWSERTQTTQRWYWINIKDL